MPDDKKKLDKELDLTMNYLFEKYLLSVQYSFQCLYG